MCKCEHRASERGVRMHCGEYVRVREYVSEGMFLGVSVGEYE